MMISTALALWAVFFLLGCEGRDKESPAVQIIAPAYDGMDAQFGDVLFIQFTATDDRDDGGIWTVELRKGDGVSVRASQIGLWQGSEIDTLVVPFGLNSSSWPTETMTIAVVIDDAAGNRGADFREFDYTSSADLPNVLAALTEEADGTSSILSFEDGSSEGDAAAGFPLSHDLAYADGFYALADAEDATVHLINRQTMALENTWNSAQSTGTLPLVRRVHALGIQAGFTIVHASGLAIINPTGALLFERFSEAPWSPIDACFSGNTCVLWEKNEASSTHRLRSWNFVTGATGPIINLAAESQGFGAVPAQTSGSAGTIFVISETGGITLIDVATGNMQDLCGLIGSGSLYGNEYTSAGIGGEQAVYVRGEQLCRQDIGPVSSGSTLPIEGDIIGMRSRNDGSIHMLLDEGGVQRFVSWSPAEAAPFESDLALPINTKAIWLVNE
tara:strand:- start:1064 stop:2398 length:1335 start_codon:yes stop_codon:yes gene_type:complete